MAKWDLSKLPEGRKPLPDEWFSERAQMQDRIKVLEAQLAEYKYVASAIDTQWAESQDEIADLKANLAKAVEALLETNAAFAKTVGLRRHKAWATINKTNRLLAELTGGKDE